LIAPLAGAQTWSEIGFNAIDDFELRTKRLSWDKCATIVSGWSDSATCDTPDCVSKIIRSDSGLPERPKQ
jgi:hypothetical protein